MNTTTPLKLLVCSLKKKKKVEPHSKVVYLYTKMREIRKQGYIEGWSNIGEKLARGQSKENADKF